jgi:hypothetical protein
LFTAGRAVAARPRLGVARVRAAQVRAPRFGMARVRSARFGTARFGPTQLVSARLGPASVARPRCARAAIVVPTFAGRTFGRVGARVARTFGRRAITRRALEGFTVARSTFRGLALSRGGFALARSAITGCALTGRTLAGVASAWSAFRRSAFARCACAGLALARRRLARFAFARRTLAFARGGLDRRAFGAARRGRARARARLLGGPRGLVVFLGTLHRSERERGRVEVVVRAQ